MMHGPAIHPGEILREEFLVPLGLSAYAVAKACGVPRTRIERLIKEATHLSTMIEDGDPLPDPTPLEMVSHEMTDLDGSAYLIDLACVVPITVTVPEYDGVHTS